MHLTENVHHLYHHVYFDNFFTSTDLMLNLFQLRTYACGTMRANRKGFPKCLQQLTKKGLPNRGDNFSPRNRNLDVVVWQGTKAISCCSTNSNSSTSSVTCKQRWLNCIHQLSTSIVNYNSKMGGVDRNDQLRGYYNIEIKSRKYFKYLFFMPHWILPSLML